MHGMLLRSRSNGLSWSFLYCDGIRAMPSGFCWPSQRPQARPRVAKSRASLSTAAASFPPLHAYHDHCCQRPKTGDFYSSAERNCSSIESWRTVSMHSYGDLTYRLLWVDFCLSPTTTMRSSQPIMVTKRTGRIERKRLVKCNSIERSVPMQSGGQVECNFAYGLTNTHDWSFFLPDTAQQPAACMPLCMP